jgi:hypothetical protein
MVGDTRHFNFGRFQTFYSCLEEIVKSIVFCFDNIEKSQNTKFSYQSLAMLKRILPTDFKKLRRLVFTKYIPGLQPHYDGTSLASLTNKSFFWRELVSVKLMFDFLIAYNLACAPYIDNMGSKMTKEVLPFAIDFFSTMPEAMVAALNEE